MVKVLIGKVNRSTIVSAMAIIGEDETTKLMDKIIDEKLEKAGLDINSEVECEESYEHPEEIFIYAIISED